MLHDLLRSFVPPAPESYRPRLFSLQRSDDARALEALFERGAIRVVQDSLETQLGELIQVRRPERKLAAPELSEHVREHLAGRSLDEYGNWVFYPWSGRLLHVLPPEELREVRCARNCYKITPAEQKTLAAARVGIIGLSVGNAAALTFALEGVGTTFKLADFDELSLSNLNRLRSGLHSLGLPKTTIAARELYELDPYLNIELYPDGLNDANMDEFLLGGGRLDLLVEECDDLFMKLAVRERARELRMPVIMDTSDRGMLDVERFDLEPDRPILHGLVGDANATSLKGLPTKEKIPIVLAILDRERMSTRMAASLPEVDETIGSWPQLASGVALGGAITCDVARRILLGQMTTSGRFYVDVEQCARDGEGLFVTPVPPPPPRELAPESCRPPALPPHPAPKVVSPETIRWLVAQAILAPSAHNAQPWRFEYRDDVLLGYHDHHHDMPTLDFEQSATQVAFGALLENLEIAARSIGLVPEFDSFPDASDADLIFRARFQPGEVEDSPLLPLLATRVTNRKHGARRPLARDEVAALEGAAKQRGARLTLIEEPAELDVLAAVMGACDRLSQLNQAIFHEVIPGYRWTREEVEARRDGLDVATMELSEPDRAGFALLSSWEITKALG
ncbi:MAG TPA: Rv1355c family protein, partial [Polyangiales bacterium]